MISSLGEVRQSSMHPSFMSMYFKVHSVSRTDPNTATIFQPQYIPTRELAKGRVAFGGQSCDCPPNCLHRSNWLTSLYHLMILQHRPRANTPSTPSLLLDPACVSSWAHHSNTTMHINFVLFMKFKKKILISVCKALVGIKIYVKPKPSIRLTGYDGSLTGSASCLRRLVLQACFIQCWWLRRNAVMKCCWAITPVATCL